MERNREFIRRVFKVLVFFTFFLGPPYLTHKMYECDDVASVMILFSWLPAIVLTEYLYKD